MTLSERFVKLFEDGTRAVLSGAKEGSSVVEKIKADGSSFVDDLDTLEADLAAAQAEIERLREALEWYADVMCEGLCKDWPPDCYVKDADCSGCKARAALKGDKNNA